MPTLEEHIAARNAEMQQKYDEAVDKTLVIDPSHYLAEFIPAKIPLMEAHMAAMEYQPEVLMIALGCRKRYKCSFVKIWHTIVDWPTALMIIRYGEFPEPGKKSGPNANGPDGGWPLKFSDTDLQAGLLLAKGEKFPTWMSLLEVDVPAPVPPAAPNVLAPPTPVVPES